MTKGKPSMAAEVAFKKSKPVTMTEMKGLFEEKKLTRHERRAYMSVHARIQKQERKKPVPGLTINSGGEHLPYCCPRCQSWYGTVEERNACRLRHRPKALRAPPPPPGPEKAPEGAQEAPGSAQDVASPSSGPSGLSPEEEHEAEALAASMLSLTPVSFGEALGEALAEERAREAEKRKDPHAFYQDAQPREVGLCDYTFPDGDWCGRSMEDHKEKGNG